MELGKTIVVNSPRKREKSHKLSQTSTFLNVCAWCVRGCQNSNPSRPPARRPSTQLDFSCESEDEMHYIVHGFRAMVAETLAAGAGSSAFGSQSWVRKDTR